jgi:hypothetical protein
VLGRAPEQAGLASRLAGRLLAGCAAGLLVFVALTQLGPSPPFDPLAAAVAAGAACALLPRIGWLVAAASVCIWLGSPAVDRPGTALVLAAALAPVPLLLPRAGVLWSVPALAPLLGTIALAPAFVGVAALAPRAAQRAGLAAAGLLWLVGAEVLTGESLLFGLPDGVEPQRDWEGSLAAATGDALHPLLTSPALAPLAVWTVFAPLLPLLVRGRSPALDAIGAAAWAAGLVAAHVALGDVLAASTALEEARGAVGGAALGALAAAAAAGLGAPAPQRRARATLSPP